MIEFILKNYSLIISVILLILDITVFPFLRSKFKKLSKSDDLLSILETLPSYISEAESLFDNGRSKLAYVLQKVHLDCVANKYTYDETLIMSYIEDILETPQKK